MKERDFDGATNNGVNPEPPSGAEDSAGDPRSKYSPYLWKIH